MRALYDPFLHGSKRHIGSEVFVSFALGPLDCHPYHHSHLISDLLQFDILGMSVRHCHILLHLYPNLFLNFLLHIFIIFRIPFHFLLSSSIFISLHERQLLWCTSPVIGHCSCRYRIESPCSHDSPIFDIVHTGVWHYLLGI